MFMCYTNVQEMIH